MCVRDGKYWTLNENETETENEMILLVVGIHEIRKRHIITINVFFSILLWIGWRRAARQAIL